MARIDPNGRVFPRRLVLCAALAAGLLGGLDSGAAERLPPAAARRLLVNDDGTNLLWREGLTPEAVRRHAAEVPNPVTTYLLCPNGIQKMLYPSALEELATRGDLPKLVAAGKDPFGSLLADLKARGFETFVTFRMNEVHNVDRPAEPDLCRLWREHPELRVERGANPKDWMAQCLDYSRAAVRERSLGLIGELLEKYLPDGIELDWMRFPRHLGGRGDEVWLKRGCLTEVVAAVRARAEEIGRRTGRKMSVAVRVPSSLAGCRAIGADIVDWNRRGLIDFLTASPFLSSDFSMPLAEMRAALAARPIPIYACIEFGFSGGPHDEATIRAAAAGLYGSGADGIYLFNFPCWIETRAHPPWSWVPQLADPRLLEGKELDFPLIDGHNRVPGVDLPSPLPAEAGARGDARLALQLPDLALSEGNRPDEARVVFEAGGGSAVSVNGREVSRGGLLPPDSLRAGTNEVIFRNSGDGPAKLSRLDLRLTYPVTRPLADPPRRADFYVSPSGSDANPGSLEAPFRTIDRAREAVRRFRTARDGDITVVLRGGAYRLDRPLAFGPADSGMGGHSVAYRAFPGESPVLSGGRAVTGWRPDGAGRWRAEVNLGDFRELYVNGRRGIRARGPCPEDLESYGDRVSIDGDGGFVFPDGAMADWPNPAGLELGFYNSWSHATALVERVTRDLRGRAVVRMRQPGFFLMLMKEGAKMTRPSYIENALELLDEPGEWYFDRSAGVLYDRPRDGEDLRQAVVTAPQLESLVRVEGDGTGFARNIVFDGLTFADAAWLRPSRDGHPDVQANFVVHEGNLFARDGSLVNTHNEYLKSPANVTLSRAEGCRFERCVFTRLGGAGLDIERGSRDNVVNGCEFFDISGSAIQIGGVLAADHHPDSPDLVVRNNRVTNSSLHDCGLEYEDSVGVFAGYTEGTIIAHNEIFRLPYSGVSIGWGWGEEDAGGGTLSLPYRYSKPTSSGANRVEANHIHQVMLLRNDGGAVYTLGDQPGTVILGNHIHDNGPGEPGGIYLDEGSGYIEVTGNVVTSVKKPIFYNNRSQDRISTCYEHDNFFGPAPGGPGFPEDAARRAGIETRRRPGQSPAAN